MNKLRRSLSIGLMGVLPGITWAYSLLFARAEAKTPGDIVETVSTANAKRTLESDFAALIDTFVPADETLGASDLGIEKPILKRISENPENLGGVVKMLETVNALTLERFGEHFNMASLSQRTKVVSTLLSGRAEYKEAQSRISSLRTSTLSAFYSSEAAFEMLDYHPPSQGGYPDYDSPPQ